MVKIRGYRVELGEIESALHRAEGVVGPETELVAFVTTAEGAALGPDAEARLRRQLAERLPKYMVPTELLWLDRLRTTSTIDETEVLPANLRNLTSMAAFVERKRAAVP